VALAEDRLGVSIHDFNRNLRTLSTGPQSGSPVWSPDGSRLIFSSGPLPVRSIYEQPSSGSVPRRLVLDEPRALLTPRDWSGDGRLLVFAKSAPGTGYMRDLWLLPLYGDAKPRPYLVTPFDEPQAALSPDGRWLAYVSGESGAYQVVVQPFPDPSGGKWRISSGAGVCPRWKRDGREIYHLDSSGRIIATAVNTDRGFEIGQSTMLFETRLGFPAISVYLPPCPYDVTGDGQRFLFSEPSEPSPITVVLNWSSTVRK
jgi:serine/threonine-protein kinase